jgi:hypothetical protein
MTNILPVLDHASAGIPASLERLFGLLRIPKSISTDPAFARPNAVVRPSGWSTDLKTHRLRGERARHARPSDGGRAS